MNSTSRLTIMLDASVLRDSSCMLRLYRKCIEGYTNRINSVDIEFGSAFHLYRKLIDTSDGSELSKLVALQQAMLSFQNTEKYMKQTKLHLTPEFLGRVCKDYSDTYPTQQEDYSVVVDPVTTNPLVELKIAYPYYITPEEDIEVLICGTIDKLTYCKSAGFYTIADYKTTSVWDSAKYFQPYELSCQLMFYKLLVGKFAEAYPASIIARIYSGGNIGAFIDGVFLSKTGATFKRSEVFFYPPSRMLEFELLVRQKMYSLISLIRSKNLTRDGMLNGSCEKVYGLCNFFQSCCEEDSSNRQMILDEQFVKRTYNPMNHGTVQ